MGEPRQLESAGASHSEVSEWAREVAEKISPSVVRIRIHKFIGGEEDPEGNPQSGRWANIGGGSGFIVHSDGWIVTNAHVESHPGTLLTVVLDSGRKAKVERAYRHPVLDVSFVKIEGNSYPALTMADLNTVKKGDRVIAMGSPLHQDSWISDGIVSRMHDPKTPPIFNDDATTITEMEQGFRGFISTNADIHHGNSGGPLVNARGEVIGINTLVDFGHGTGAIGHAIPISEIATTVKYIEAFVLIQAKFKEIVAARKDVDDSRGISMPKAYKSFLQGIRTTIAAYVPEAGRKDAAREILADFGIQAMCRGLTAGHRKPEIYAAIEKEIFPEHAPIVFQSAPPDIRQN